MNDNPHEAANEFLAGLSDEQLWELREKQYGTHSTAHMLLAVGPGELVGSCLACDNEDAIDRELDRRGRP